MDLARALRTLFVLLSFVSVELVAAPEQILRLGTGGTGGTYFPVGSVIAHVVSEPRFGSNDYGVPGLLVVPQISNGSVSNVDALRKGWLDLALVQADVAYWAYRGTAVYSEQEPFDELRA
ncbi:MAG: hypothetical protein K0U93_11050, partial [Gammaproteobacteria bacterium]|nr:hypothetical protein [Gammaproteobacteria bacterium]